MAFLYPRALFWHGTIALYHYQPQEQDTGTIKQFIFPAQLMFCWWLWSPLPLTVEARGPRYRQLYIPLGFIFTTMGAKIILNILCCLVFSNVALLTPLLLLWVPWCQILFLIALNKILQTMSQWLTVSSVMIMNMNPFIPTDQEKGQVIPSSQWYYDQWPLIWPRYGGQDQLSVLGRRRRHRDCHWGRGLAAPASRSPRDPRVGQWPWPS